MVHVDNIKPYLGQGTPLAWCDSSEGSKSVNHNTAVPDHTESQSDVQDKEPEPYRTRYGRHINPPNQYAP